MNNITTVGVDIAKNYFDVCILPTKQTFNFINNDIGFKKLLKILKEHPDVFRVVIEHTGGYQKPLVAFLQKHGLPVSVINPLRSKYFAKANGTIAKTDKIDAENLALFGAVQKPAITPVADENLAKIRGLVQRKMSLIKMRTSEKAKLDKNPSLFLKQSVNRMIRRLESEILLIGEEIEKRIKDDENLSRKNELLRSVSGVGRETAAVLITMMPELGTIGRREIAALAGLAPINRDSGAKKGRAFIQAGRSGVRTALYMPTISATIYNPVVRLQYQKLKNRGKPGKVAITACMRKMLVYLNSHMAQNFYNLKLDL